MSKKFRSNIESWGLSEEYLDFFLPAAWIFALSFVLRLNLLGYSGFNLDEMNSVRLAEEFSFGNLLADNHPPLILLFVRLSTSILGFSEFSARLPSALFSALTTILLGYLARRTYGRGTALLAMLLHALLPMSIRIGQLVRPYALLEFLTVLQMFYFQQFFSRQDLRAKNKLLVSSLLVLLTSYLAIIPFCFEFICFQIEKRDKKTIIATVFGALILLIFAGDFLDWSSLDWQLVRFQEEKWSFLPIEPIMGISFSSFLSFVGILILIGIYLSRMKLEQFNKIKGPVFSSSLILIALIAFSFFSKRAVFLERYYSFLGPFACLLISCMAVSLFKTKKIYWIFVGFVAVMIIFCGSGLSLQGFYPVRHSPWREAAIKISQSPSSIVVSTMRPSLRYPYFQGYGIELQPFFDPQQAAIQIKETLKRASNVWIVDNLNSYLRYRTALINAKEYKEMDVLDLSSIEDGIENIVVINFTLKKVAK